MAIGNALVAPSAGGAGLEIPFALLWVLLIFYELIAAPVAWQAGWRYTLTAGQAS